MDKSINGHQSMENAIIEAVWYEGTDALKEGEAVCYDIAHGTATARAGERINNVSRPRTTNNKAFAGVVARDYSAQSGGQLIEINCPGSRGVNVALGVDTVIGTGMLTFTVGSAGEAGRFVKGGFKGRGSIIPRQTVTAVIEASMIGAWSLNAAGTTLTMSDTTGLSVGDTVVILGGENDGTGAAVPGKYTILTVPAGGTTVTIASAVTATAGGAILCTGYAYTGNPKCQADLLEGEESGGVEFINPLKAGSDTISCMVGGWTYICGGYTLSVDAETDLAEGTVFGLRKGFWCLGALGTSDFVVDLVTPGYLITGADMDEINAIDAAEDMCALEWNGCWKIIGQAGGATPTHA